MSEVRIELYQPAYREDFVRLNSEWIRRFFHLESSDRVVLNDPEGYILNKGGQIFFALNESGHVIGCCALIAHPEKEGLELAKMAVSPRFQGMGTGRLLGEAALAYARTQGVKKLFLEGNTRLEASIALYRRLGFREIPMVHPAYERCNIMMELHLQSETK